MSKMWEYHEVEHYVLEDWFDDAIQETEQREYNRRQYILNSLGSRGWELIGIRYIPVKPDKKGNPRGKTYHTFRREITSGISTEEREKDIREDYKVKQGSYP